MGIFEGLLETAISPIKVVTKTTEKVFLEDWKPVDAASLGVTKVIESVGEEAQDINKKFEK